MYNITQKLWDTVNCIAQRNPKKLQDLNLLEMASTQHTSFFQYC